MGGSDGIAGRCSNNGGSDGQLFAVNYIHLWSESETRLQRVVMDAKEVRFTRSTESLNELSREKDGGGCAAELPASEWRRLVEVHNN